MMSVMAAVEVSLWTTHTALISCDLSSRSRLDLCGVRAATPIRGDDSGCKPIFVAIVFHSDAK